MIRIRKDENYQELANYLLHSKDDLEESVKAGLAMPTVRAWMNGKAAPTLKNFVKVLDVLGLELIIEKKGVQNEAEKMAISHEVDVILEALAKISEEVGQ